MTAWEYSNWVRNSTIFPQIVSSLEWSDDKSKVMYSEEATKLCEISTILHFYYIGQTYDEDSAKFLGHLRIYELYYEKSNFKG